MNVFRNANATDIDRIMEIVHDAQLSLGSRSIDQWQNGYPDRETITHDIENHAGYVIDVDDEAAAYAAILLNGEPEYNRLIGQWQSDPDNDYVVVHRLCVSKRFIRQGLASDMLRHAARIAILKDVHSFRIDTHKDNLFMLNLLQKFGFVHCGEIHYEHGDRIAFEKVL